MRNLALAALLLFAGCATVPGPKQFRQVRNGMTCQEVRDQLGRPNDINVSRVSGRERQQWVYQSRDYGTGGGYVYFNGACQVTGVQY